VAQAPTQPLCCLLTNKLSGNTTRRWQVRHTDVSTSNDQPMLRTGYLFEDGSADGLTADSMLKASEQSVRKPRRVSERRVFSLGQWIVRPAWSCPGVIAPRAAGFLERLGR
jgi:hypothetical protein